ncbi:MAG: twin-arginine translocation signal domain-containing protein [Dehalococcoidia bacterium]|nr:MAG: twin-arginine translocation signal domain-containing protein [Dehalococcoidia bacterium]
MKNEINSGGTTRRSFLKMIGGLGLAAIAGGAAYKLELGPFKKTYDAADVPTSFDPSIGEKKTSEDGKQSIVTSLIGDNNTLNTTLETIQSLPSFDSEGNPLLYFVPPKQGDIIEYNSTIDKVNLTLDGKTTVIDFLGIMIKVDKDYVVPMPIDGNIVGTNKSDGSFGGYWVYCTDSNGTRRHMFVTTYDNPTFLQNVPRVYINRPDADNVAYNASIPLKRGAELLRTNKSTYVAYGSSVLDNLNLQPLTVTDSSGLPKIPRVE